MEAFDVKERNDRTQWYFEQFMPFLFLLFLLNVTRQILSLKLIWLDFGHKELRNYFLLGFTFLSRRIFQFFRSGQIFD